MNAAAAQNQAAVQSQADTFGRSLFAGQVNDSSISDTQFVTNLYEAFLQRGPDAGGLGWWSGQATVGTGRQNVLGAFAGCPAFRDLSGTLYREANWLVSDHLGTPRMIANKSGSLASIKRHDYLPFGEELSANIGGRTTMQGYTADSVRQKFTAKEHDTETGLDYFLARYYSSTQGRFTSPDPLHSSGRSLQPQSWNRYTYCVDNPVQFIDPRGLDWGTYDLGNGTTSFVWFKGKVGKYNGRQYSRFDPGKTGTVIPLVGGGSARIYQNGNREYMGGPAKITSIRGQDNLNLSAGLVHGTASSLASFNPVAGAAVNWAMNQIGGVDQSSDLYSKGNAIGGLTTAGALLFAAPGAAEEETTTLYRAVKQGELEDIFATATYRVADGQSEGKYFFEAAEDAVDFGQQMFRTHPGEGPYTVTSAAVDRAVIQASSPVRAALEGPGLFVPKSQLPLGPVKVVGPVPH
ncbi:MAG: hypothetical protein QOF62_1071 [Pyrinomonadaceae bacterium]|nr:hypothetical protein [Pyrinomonadaceae bacterium]